MATRMKVQGPPGSFIVRDVASVPGGMALCIKLPTGKLGNYQIERVNTDRHPTGVGWRIKGSKQMFPSLNQMIAFYKEMPRQPFGFVWNDQKISGRDFGSPTSPRSPRSPRSPTGSRADPRSPQTPWSPTGSQINNTYHTHNTTYSTYASGGGGMPSVFKGRRGDFEFQNEQAQQARQKAARSQAKLHIERERVKQLESQLQQERARASSGNRSTVQALKSEVRDLKSSVSGQDAQMVQRIALMEQRLMSERTAVQELTNQLRVDIASARELRASAAEAAAARKASGRGNGGRGAASPRGFVEDGADHERAVVQDLRAQLLAEKQRVRELIAVTKGSGPSAEELAKVEFSKVAQGKANDGGNERAQQQQPQRRLSAAEVMKDAGLANWHMFPSLQGLAPPDLSATETGEARAARYLANRDDLGPKDTLVLEGPVKGSNYGTSTAPRSAPSVQSSAAHEPMTVEQKIEAARKEAARIKALYEAGRANSPVRFAKGRAAAANADAIDLGLDQYENVNLQSPASAQAGLRNQRRQKHSRDQSAYGSYAEEVEAAVGRAMQDGPGRRHRGGSPAKSHQESLLEFQLRNTKLHSALAANSNSAASAAPMHGADWPQRAANAVNAADAAPSLYNEVKPLPAAISGETAQRMHFDRMRAVMEESRKGTESAIKEGLVHDLDREEERLLDAIQQKTTLVASLEQQSKHVSSFLVQAQAQVTNLDLQDRTAETNIAALEGALAKLATEKDKVESELAASDVQLAKVHGDKVYAKGSYDTWDAKLKTRESERQTLEAALETQRQKQVMLSSDEARARAELAEEEDRMVELLSEEAQIEAIITSKEVEMAAKLANTRMATNQRNAAKQDAARRAIEEQRLLGAAESGIGRAMMAGGGAPSSDQVQQLLSSSVIGIDEALLDMNFGISDDMRLTAAEHHLATLEAAFQKAQHQLVLAEGAAQLSQQYPDAMAAMASDYTADETAGMAKLSSKVQADAAAHYNAGLSVYGSILDQPFANAEQPARTNAAAVGEQEMVNGFGSDGSSVSWSSDDDSDDSSAHVSAVLERAATNVLRVSAPTFETHTHLVFALLIHCPILACFLRAFLRFPSRMGVLFLALSILLLRAPRPLATSLYLVILCTLLGWHATML